MMNNGTGLLKKQEPSFYSLPRSCRPAAGSLWQRASSPRSYWCT